MKELINEFDHALSHLYKVLEIWEDLDEKDDAKLTEHYNLNISFDEVVYEIYCFVQDLKNNRGYPHENS